MVSPHQPDMNAAVCCCLRVKTGGKSPPIRKIMKLLIMLEAELIETQIVQTESCVNTNTSSQRIIAIKIPVAGNMMN